MLKRCRRGAALGESCLKPFLRVEKSSDYSAERLGRGGFLVTNTNSQEMRARSISGKNLLLRLNSINDMFTVLSSQPTIHSCSRSR